MRRVMLALIVAVGLSAGLTGCGDTHSTSQQPPPAEKVKETKTKSGQQVPSGSATMPKEPGR